MSRRYCEEVNKYTLSTTSPIWKIFYCMFQENSYTFLGMSKTVLSFKIDIELKEILQELANKETRTLSNYMLTVIQAHLESKGVYWKPEDPEQRVEEQEERARSAIRFSTKDLGSSFDEKA